jgi:hypothetical protein
MNLTDLTEVLRDHAELDDTAHDARMAGIRGRVLATRRRLALTGVVCVVLALVGAMYVALPRPVEPAQPTPQPTRSFPEYQEGARLVAQEWADLPTNSVTVEFMPNSDDFVIFEHCFAESSERSLVMVLTVNGHFAGSGDCIGAATRRFGDLAKYGGAVGRPLVITMTVGFESVGELPEKAEDIRPPDSTVTGEVAVGAGVPVPVSAYSFPPRPETLEDIDHDPGFPGEGSGEINIRADRNDPDAPQTLNVTWSGPYRLLVSINTPGRIEVLINGEAVHDVDSWDYGGVSGFTILGEEDGPHLPPGQTATITVIPERTTGDWSVQLSETN